MKHNPHSSLAFLILLSLVTCLAKAQPAEPGYPASFSHKLSNADLPIVSLPYFNNDELIAADTCETCSEAFGIDALAPFDFWKESQLEIISNNFEHVEIYRVKIKSPTANALHVIFEHFELGLILRYISIVLMIHHEFWEHIQLITTKMIYLLSAIEYLITN